MFHEQIRYEYIQVLAVDKHTPHFTLWQNEIKKAKSKNENRKTKIEKRKTKIEKRKAKFRSRLINSLTKSKNENRKSKIEKRKSKFFSESPNQSISFARGPNSF